MDKVGMYKARVIKNADGAWAQYGERENGNLEIILDMNMQVEGGFLRRSVALYINDKTLEFTIERLRACGWKGEDIANLEGVGDNEVDLEVTVETATEIKSRSPSYTGGDKNKYNIITGGGRFTVQNAIDPKMFAAKFAAVRGTMGGGAAPAAKPPKPPF